MQCGSVLMARLCCALLLLTHAATPLLCLLCVMTVAQDLRAYLERHTDAMHMTAGPRAGLWRQQLRMHRQPARYMRRLSSRQS